MLREIAGVRELHMDVPVGATAGQIGAMVARRFDAMAVQIPRIAYAVNQAYVPADHPLCDGDEIALIPPVSGG